MEEIHYIGKDTILWVIISQSIYLLIADYKFKI